MFALRKLLVLLAAVVLAAGTSSIAWAHGRPDDPSGSSDNPDGTFQGKSQSRPDQDGIGADHGIVNNDKTGPGTDGNNGCGNDADREDDDNGWCGNKPAKVKPTEAPTGSPGESHEVSPSVAGQGPAEVLGETFTRPEVLGRNLARTGVALTMFVSVALILGLFGFALRAIARPHRR